RECIADRVRRLILDRILNGVYPPGFRLVEMQIARELDVSQAPVREALRELEAAHIVETRPLRGTRARVVRPRELAEAYQVRAVREEHAARLVAQHLSGRSGELRAAAQGAAEAARRRDPEGYLRHNLAFHRAIVEASGNQVLERLWKSIGLALGAHVRAEGGEGVMAAAAREHHRIVERLARGDGRAAGRLLRAHAEAFAAHGAARPGKPAPERSSGEESVRDTCSLRGHRDDSSQGQWKRTIVRRRSANAAA